MTNQREKEGILSGIIGLILNILLGIVKLIGGFVTGSVSIMTDAVNNLSDAMTSILTVVSFFIVGKKADKRHPYGHGRFEYITSFLISVLVVVVGLEFLKESILRFFVENTITFALFPIAVLIFSIVIKGIMFILFTIKSKKINSGTLKAVATDSRNDCIITFVVLIGFIGGKYTSFPIDALCGTAVSILIIISGISLVLKTINKLMGDNGSDELRKNIHDIVYTFPQVRGMHDLNIHDYGQDRILASVDLEFDENMSLIDSHSVVDNIERLVHKKLNVELVIHCDPINVDDKNIINIRHIIYDILSKYSSATMHDLNIYYDEKIISFHLRLSEQWMKNKEVIIYQIKQDIMPIMPDFTLDINYDLN